MAVFAVAGFILILGLLTSSAGYHQPYPYVKNKCPSVLYGIFVDEKDRSDYWESEEGQARELFCSIQHESRLGLSLLVAIPTAILGGVAWARWPREEP